MKSFPPPERRPPFLRTLLGVLGMGLAVGSAPASAEAPALPPGVSAQVAERIEAALPESAPARPRAERRVLVFYRTVGFRHGSIPVGNHALVRLGEKTGAYTAEVTDDLAAFEPENLARFDVVMMNNTTGNVFLPKDPTDEDREREARLQAAFLDFVREGKGLAGIHAATDTFYNWPEYGEMIGAYFTSHPWNTTVAVRIEDPGHPLVAMFPREGFRIRDEIYQFAERRGGQPYSRTRLRVLMGLDPEAFDVSRGGRPDRDYPISWVRAEGRGRVFYTSLGHRNEIFWNPQVLAHILAGIQFAAGDIEADTSPLPLPGAAEAGTP